MLDCHKMLVQTLDVRQQLDRDIQNFRGTQYDVAVVGRTDWGVHSFKYVIFAPKKWTNLKKMKTYLSSKFFFAFS